MLQQKEEKLHNEFKPRHSGGVFWLSKKQEFALTKEDTLERIMNQYSQDETSAKQYMKNYWKS